MASNSQNKSVSITNRKARYEYQLFDVFTAGLQLTGTEIKSIRQGNANLNEAYCFIQDNEAWVKGMYVAEYSHGSFMNHEPKRIRKLLLNKKEIKKISSFLQDEGATVVPLKLFVNEKGWAKLEIALAKGKKLYDKRQDLKDKVDKRQVDRALKDI